MKVRVRQQNGVDAVHIDGQRLPVHQAELLEPLEQAAIDKYAMASDRQQKLAARDRAGSAKESENRGWGVHDAVLVSATFQHVVGKIVETEAQVIRRIAERWRERVLLTNLWVTPLPEHV